MSARRVIAGVALSITTSIAVADVAPRPDALLMVDQHREAIVERVVKAWPEALTAEQADVLRKTLAGLRADWLLAISISPGLGSLLGVLQGVDKLEPSKGTLAASKALGDLNADVVYTPVTPCRIVDTRSGAGGALAGGDTRNWLAANPGGTFAAQGGSTTNCGITLKPAAVMANLTVANTQSGPALITAWPFNQPKPNAATLNWVEAGTQLANAVILPLCTGGACTADWSLWASSGTDLIVDVVGYFAAPASYAKPILPLVWVDGTGTFAGRAGPGFSIEVATQGRNILLELAQTWPAGYRLKENNVELWFEGLNCTGRIFFYPDDINSGHMGGDVLAGTSTFSGTSMLYISGSTLVAQPSVQSRFQGTCSNFGGVIHPTVSLYEVTGPFPIPIASGPYHLK